MKTEPVKPLMYKNTVILTYHKNGVKDFPAGRYPINAEGGNRGNVFIYDDYADSGVRFGWWSENCTKRAVEELQAIVLASSGDEGVPASACIDAVYLYVGYIYPEAIRGAGEKQKALGVKNLNFVSCSCCYKEQKTKIAADLEAQIQFCDKSEETLSGIVKAALNPSE